MKTSPKRYENVDWERLRKALAHRADQLSRASDQVDGATPQDLADQVMSDFFLHPDGMDWDPKKGPIDAFLRTILDSRWLDGRRRQSTVEQPVNPRVELDRRKFLEAIRRPLEDKPELLEVIEAVEILDGNYHLVDQELAKLIGTTVKDIENRKKKLRSALSGLPI